MTRRRHWRENPRFGAACLLLALVLLAYDSAHEQGLTLTDACGLSEAASAQVYDFESGAGTTVTEARALQALGAWTGDSTWVQTAGYGYFDEPDDLMYRWEIDLDTPGGTRWLFVYRSPTAPESVWLYGFNSLYASADANGDHWGLHDLCVYWKVDAPLVLDWIAEVTHDPSH